MTPLWIFELYILATIVCDARGVRRGIIKQTTETHCLIGVWLFLVDLPCVCEPVRGLSAPQLWLSRSPTTLQPYYVILIFEIKSQILKTVFSQAFSNVASVCGPSSSPSVLDDGGNPCFDPAAKTSALKMSFFFFFYNFDLADILHTGLNWTYFECWSIFSFTHVYYHNWGRSGKPDNL